MSFRDTDLYNGFSIGYDQFPSYIDDADGTDINLLYSNRANKYGEIDDTLYPISNWRGGYMIEGGGPHLSYPTQQKPPYIPREEPLPSLPDNRSKGGATIGDLVKMKKDEGKKSEVSGAVGEKKEKFRVSSLFKSLDFMLVLLFILVCIVIAQYFQVQNLSSNIQLLLGVLLKK